MKRRLLNILFWSIISAAFIGPGTVTTASNAGASYGASMMLALVFSVLGCLVLQEAAARLTIITGMNLGEALARKYSSGNAFKGLILGGLLVGGIAYQAGNILGAVSGLRLLMGVSREWLVVLLSTAAALILWTGRIQLVARIMGTLVAVMGLAFITGSFLVTPLPKPMPGFGDPGVSLLVIGLVGTTIVPYNLFLGSGISQGQSVREMRAGLIPAILLGGLISGAIILVGSGIDLPFTFEKLAGQFGSPGLWIVGIGLGAAGFSSAITAPLAAAVTAKSLFNLEESSLKYRAVWILVLVCGVIFGISGVRPVPAIILAQAINGLLLPGFTIFLILILNDERIVPANSRQNWMNNLLLFVVLGLTSFLGLHNLAGSFQKVGQFSVGFSLVYIFTISSLSASICLMVLLKIRRA